MTAEHQTHDEDRLPDGARPDRGEAGGAVQAHAAMPSDAPGRDGLAPPSRKELLLITGISISLAAVVLVVAVLPAEYNIDPTGLGGLMGLTSGPESVGIDQHMLRETPWATHRFTFTFGPNADWQEEKVRMVAGDSFVYRWSADGPLEYDLHVLPDEGEGEPSFDRGVSSARNGSLTATFDGAHGWAFRNPGDQTVTVTVELAGFFRL